MVEAGAGSAAVVDVPAAAAQEGAGDMNTKEFISKLDQEKVVAAIAEAERQTSGEIRVYISQRNRADGLAAAQVRFKKLGMHKTHERNAVLIYVAPVAQTFGIVGDEAVHSRCAENFWQDVRDAMAAEFKAVRFTEGLVAAVNLVGAELKRHFPHHADDKNTHSNEIDIE